MELKIGRRVGEKVRRLCSCSNATSHLVTPPPPPSPLLILAAQEHLALKQPNKRATGRTRSEREKKV